MRGSVVQLIARKEFRDLIRDRRTVMLVIVLPAVLYPLFIVTGIVFAASLAGNPPVIGVVGAEHLPPPDSGQPPLLVSGRLAEGLDPSGEDAAPVAVRPLDGDPGELLRAKKADAVLVVPPGFATEASKVGGRPELTIRFREGDDKAKIAARRLAEVVRAWEAKYREARFAARGLPRDFGQVFTVKDPQTDRPKAKRAADELRDMFARVFPLILMMWLIAGAIQPAVDMTAGERERGTMETLLISPAERSEIVAGKFLATTAFAFASVVWNVTWLTGMAVGAEFALGFPIVKLAGLVACVVVGLPLAMLFSAVCLALGVFARSTKEGQYYLMPLLLVSMPLALWSMTPGSELGPRNAWVPVTGAMLLQQRLLAVTAEPVPWGHFAAVIGSLMVWVALALGFAVWQFTRESVLFREAGPPPGRGVFRRLFKRDAA